MPLGVAYMKAVMDRDEPEIHSRLFVYPEQLLDALVANPPDALMMSNYVWNEALSFHFGKLMKRIRPETLVVMGGPNISLEPERQVEYFSQHPEVDLYALGEGDFLALEIVRHFLDAGKSLGKFRSREVPSSIYRGPEGQLIRNPTRSRHKEVEEIPSPWLTGIQDEFFDGKLAPMIETNRGCPFTCTFCAQGTTWYTKVHNFSIERMREEIQYIARRIRSASPNMGTLRIADSNYGMFERDIEISGYIGEMQREYGWPTFIDATTGKNRPERIIKSLEQVSGALVLYQAVQSLDEDVLRNVRRTTISLGAYEALQVHMRGRGLRSTSDLILGLPGESLRTHLAALHKLLDSNINQLHNFQAMMLKGAEMETVASRQQFSFDTRFRVLPKNFGIYEGEKVFDVEEIIVGTATLPFEDYVTARKYHLTSSVFWNDSWFDPVVRFVRAFDIKISEWWEQMPTAMETGRLSVRRFLDDFVSETINELFPTREACVEFYSQEENFQRLRQGEIGDNLMYKYRAIASFYLWEQICETAMTATRALLEGCGVVERIPHFNEFWLDFHRYIELKHAHGRTREQILSSARVELRYDFERWLEEGDLTKPEAYRLAEPIEFEFRLNEEAMRELDAALQVWTTELKGLTKMVTRIKTSWQVRDCYATYPEHRLKERLYMTSGALV
jgi:radical SAM superfamily enzyme YgiQ (UPF0313 family)